MAPPEALGWATTDAAAIVGAATVGALLRRATEILRSTSESARLDAELLLGHALGRPRERLILDRDEPVAPAQAATFAALVDRRAAREPVAYLVGERGFRWLQLGVDPRVLIPRPETELLVECALTLPAGATVLDVGTGSGAIALALAHERPDLVITAVDASADALAVAQANAQRLGLTGVRFGTSDLLAAVPQRFDAVLANLPYIARDAALPADVADHEPHLALFGGPDGLGLIRRLVAQLTQREPADRPDLLGLEIGEDQGQAVAGLVASLGYPTVEVQRDLAGSDRVVTGERPR